MHRGITIVSILTLFMVAEGARGHGFPLLITSSEGKLSYLNQVPVGQLVDDGFEIFGEDPGIGVNFSVTGPPSGTELQLEILGGLLYWDHMGPGFDGRFAHHRGSRVR